MRSYRDEHRQRRQTPPDARISIKIAKGLSAGDVKRILAEAQRARLYTLYVLAPPSASVAANSSAYSGRI
jgi:hypothetical protein